MRDEVGPNSCPFEMKDVWEIEVEGAEVLSMLLGAAGSVRSWLCMFSYWLPLRLSRKLPKVNRATESSVVTRLS